MPKLHRTLFTTHTIPKIAQFGPQKHRAKTRVDIYFKISLLFFNNKTFLFVSRIQQHGHALDLSSRKVFYLLVLHPSMTNKLKEAGGEANV